MNMMYGYKYNVLGIFLVLAKDNRETTFEAKSNTALTRHFLNLRTKEQYARLGTPAARTLGRSISAF
jgi:hypothetical protein